MRLRVRDVRCRVRTRRVEWESAHPEEVAAFYAKAKADKENAKLQRLENDRVRTALLQQKLAEESESAKHSLQAATSATPLSEHQ